MSIEDTRTNILDHAIDQFWQKSYRGVNMNALSRAIGINKATIYQHFTSKEELAVAAVKRSTERSTAYAYTATFAETNDPVERLKTIYQKAYQLQAHYFDSEGQSRGCPFVSLGVEMATSSDQIREAVNDNFVALRPFYARIIDAWWGEHPPEDATEKDALISTLIANMNGCLVAAKLENRPETVLDGQARALRILGM